MQLPEDFREFIELMKSNGVRFVMIGGYAYNLYCNPRATGDIDFFISTDEENQKKLRKALEDFGFGSTLPDDDHPILRDGQVLMLGRSPFRIDLLTRIDGVEFEEVEQTRLWVKLSDLDVPVISPELLLRNKQSTGRLKDLADAEALQNHLNLDKHE